MKKTLIFFSLFSFFLFSNSTVFAEASRLKQPQQSMELSFQDLPEGNFSSKAQELDMGSADSKGEHRTVIVIGIIAGVLALGGVIVPLVVLK